MRDIFRLAILLSTIRLATPLLLAALGGLLSERSGVINIALEGLMLAGAFTGAAVTHYAGNPWIGLLGGIAAGIFIASVHAIACIRLRCCAQMYRLIRSPHRRWDCRRAQGPATCCSVLKRAFCSLLSVA